MRDELSRLGLLLLLVQQSSSRRRSPALERQRAPSSQPARDRARGSVQGADRPARAAPHLLLAPWIPAWPSSCPPLAHLSEPKAEVLEVMVFAPGEKPGTEPEEAKLQNASRQIVQKAILQAVQQVSQESRRREGRPGDSRARGQLGGRELTKKQEKK